jgi:apolipoprotein N-acyltransferase
MLTAAPLLSLIAGASLLAIVMQLTIPLASWLALTLLLHASRSLPTLSGMACVWLALYVAVLVGMRGILPVSGAAAFVIVGLFATTVMLPVAVDRIATTRMTGLPLTLTFPVALVTAEFLRSRFTPAATWGSLAYTQAGNLPLMQVAALVGIWGITFLMAWGASTIEWAWARALDWPTVRIPVLAYTSVLGIVMLTGSARLAWAPTDRPSIRAATLNRPKDLFAPGEMTRIAEGRIAADERPRVVSQLTRLHNWFLDGSHREALAGARVIAWPEQNLLILHEDEASFIDRARRLAADDHVYLVMGMGTIHVGDPLPFENKAIVIDPTGTVVVSYLKSHPVEGWEASIMRVGDGRVPVVATHDGRMSTVICQDGAFPEFVRQAGQQSADLLVVPVNDWKAIKTIHAQMDAFRAIENGVAIVRPAASGISAAYDPWGRTLGMADYFAPGDGVLVAQVPVGSVRTIYARTGDVFAWLCVVIVVILIFVVIGSKV